MVLVRSPRFFWGDGGRCCTFAEAVTLPVRLGLLLIGPGCLTLVVWWLKNATSLWGFWRIWCGFEALWFVHSMVQVHTTLGTPRPPLSNNPTRFPPGERLDTFHAVIELESSTTPTRLQKFVTGWFFDAPYETLTIGDVRSFLAALSCNCAYNLLDVGIQQQVDVLIIKIERHAGALLPTTSTSGATLMSLYTDSFWPAINPHPLFLALVLDVGLNRLVSWLVMRVGLGMERVRALPLSVASPAIYLWQSRHTGGSPTVSSVGGLRRQQQPQPPIVFFHGVGVGLVAYYKLLRHVLQHCAAKQGQQQPLWVLELPYISSSMVYYADVPTPEQITHTLDDMITSYYKNNGGGTFNVGADHGADFIGHSYGTVTLTQILKCRPQLVRRCLFVDPVCVGLHRKDLCRNFVYTPPRRSAKLALQSHLVNGGIKLMYVLMREFWWWENVLLKSDVERVSSKGEGRVTFFVSGEDQYVPADGTVRDMQACKHAGVRCWNDVKHGDVCFVEKLCIEVGQWCADSRF